jgi:hypothetical protein
MAVLQRLHHQGDIGNVRKLVDEALKKNPFIQGVRPGRKVSKGGEEVAPQKRSDRVRVSTDISFSWAKNDTIFTAQMGDKKIDLNLKGKVTPTSITVLHCGGRKRKGILNQVQKVFDELFPQPSAEGVRRVVPRIGKKFIVIKHPLHQTESCSMESDTNLNKGRCQYGTHYHV